MGLTLIWGDFFFFFFLLNGEIVELLTLQMPNCVVRILDIFRVSI